MRDDTLLPGKGAYTAVYSRQPDGAWIVYVRGHRHEIHSFARSLRRARENIRDALSLWYEDADSATIVDRVELERTLEVPISWFPRLRKATPEERADGVRVGGESS